MNVKQLIKASVSTLSKYSCFNQILRNTYKCNLLIPMYHGVTQEYYNPLIWSQLPAPIFEKHLRWIAKNYVPVTLTQVISAVTGEGVLPERAVLLTFDDGLKNNYSVAYPLLKKYKIPAAIFLTVDFVGSDKFFWVDEVWLTIKEAVEKNVDLKLNSEVANACFSKKEYWNAYLIEVEYLKFIDEDERQTKISFIFNQLQIDKNTYVNDFGMLTWDDVSEMDKGGIVEFGTHTATHRILTTIPSEELDDELFGAKSRLEGRLGHNVDAFCYPNGRLGIDFTDQHQEMLKTGGYKCAFSTEVGLCKVEENNNFSIPRVAAACDELKDSDFFFMDASGACEFRKRLQQGRRDAVFNREK